MRVVTAIEPEVGAGRLGHPPERAGLEPLEPTRPRGAATPLAIAPSSNAGSKVMRAMAARAAFSA